MVTRPPVDVRARLAAVKDYLQRNGLFALPAERLDQMASMRVSHFYCTDGTIMATTAHVVVDAVDARRPGLSDTKRNLLLFFAQGHQLAHNGDALFAEPLYATDRGVDIGGTAGDIAGDPLTPGQLNTVGDVLDRYADLSPADLRTLVQSSAPWQQAGPGGLVDLDGLTDWFRRADETEDPDNDRPAQSRIAAWRARSATR